MHPGCVLSGWGVGNTYVESLEEEKKVGGQRAFLYLAGRR